MFICVNNQDMLCTYYVCIILKQYWKGPHTLHTLTAIKCCYLSYTPQLFFANATIFPTVFYESNDFLTNLFRKIIAVLCVVCKGLHNNLAQFYNKLNFDTTKAHKIMSTQQYKLLSTADLPDEQIVL